MNPRLCHVAKVNPATPEFDQLSDDAQLPFLPLEAVWPSGRLDVSRRRSRAEGAVGYTRFREGDILLPKITPTFQADRSVIAQPIEGGVGVGTTELHTIRVSSNTDVRYVRYLLASKPFLDEGEASMLGVAGQQRVPEEFVRNVRVPVTEIGAQRRIANYLDAETARIDALIEKKRRMMELLGLRMHSAREELVREARCSDKSERLGRVLREIDDRLGEAAEPPPLLSVSIHRGVIPFAEANPDRPPRADDLYSYKLCQADDIVLNRMRAFQGGIGRAGVVGLVSPDYAVLRPARSASARYLDHLLRSPWFVGQMTQLVRGIGGVSQGNVRTPRVNWDDLREVHVPLPSRDTQEQLTDSLDIGLKGAREAQRMITQQINLLAERRQALITAAVTGELDISGVAA